MSDCLGERLAAVCCLAGAASLIYSMKRNRSRATPTCCPYNSVTIKIDEAVNSCQLSSSMMLIAEQKEWNDGCWCKAVEILVLAERIAADIGAKVSLKKLLYF